SANVLGSKTMKHPSARACRIVFILRLLRPPRSALFPYTTLFRSGRRRVGRPRGLAVAVAPDADGLDVRGRAAQPPPAAGDGGARSEEHTSELQSRGHLVCRLLLEKKKHRERLQHS